MHTPESQSVQTREMLNSFSFHCLQYTVEELLGRGPFRKRRSSGECKHLWFPYSVFWPMESFKSNADEIIGWSHVHCFIMVKREDPAQARDVIVSIN